jgi:hypothetical protein
MTNVLANHLPNFLSPDSTWSYILMSRARTSSRKERMEDRVGQSSSASGTLEWFLQKSGDVNEWTCDGMMGDGTYVAVVGVIDVWVDSSL